MLRWLWQNLGSLVLAFIMALLVWIVAVNAEDPIQEGPFPGNLPIEIRNVPEGLLLIDPLPRTEGRVILRAPRSVWDRLEAEDLTLWVDLAGLAAGTQHVPVQVTVEAEPLQVVAVEPESLTLTLEPTATRRIPIAVHTTGDVAIGFRVDAAEVAPTEATVVGPASLVTRIASLWAEVDLTGRRQSLEQEVPLVPVDAQRAVVEGMLQIDPPTATVRVHIEELGGYRSLAVVPRIEGQVAPGYQITNISVTPTLVTVFSTDPEAVDALAGFVETLPVNLDGATADVERRVGLDLPEGVSLVGDQTVLVRVSIAPIQSSITLTRTPQVQGLAPGLFASVSPTTVSLIITGPLPVLETLGPDDVRMVLDLTGLDIGTYALTPKFEDLPAGVAVQTVLPETIEVVLSDTPPPTLTPTPSLTPTPAP